jgi:hypothetical protein
MPKQITLNDLAKSKVLKAFIDNTAKSLDGIQWKKWFKWKYTPTLTFEGILAGAARVNAGSVEEYGARAPRRERPTAQQFNGTVASLKDGFQLDQKELRRYMELEDALRSGTIENGNAVFEELFPDMKALMLAPHKRLDMWAGEILSNGSVTVAASDNPQGVNFDIDFNVKKDKVITKAWSVSHSDHKPLSDIRTIIDEQKAHGRTYSKVKMTRSTFNKMIASTEFQNLFGLQISKGNKTYSQNPVNVITKEMVNIQLEAIGLPEIELVEYTVALTDDSTVQPFKDDRMLFHNGEDFGDAYYTYANEQRMPVSGVVYTVNDNVLFKHKVGEDFRLFEYELNSFLVPKMINNMLIVDTANKRA